MTSINRDSSIIVIGGSYRWHILWSIFIYLNFSNMMIFFSSFYKFVSPLVSVIVNPHSSLPIVGVVREQHE